MGHVCIEECVCPRQCGMVCVFLSVCVRVRACVGGHSVSSVRGCVFWSLCVLVCL